METPNHGRKFNGNEYMFDPISDVNSSSYGPRVDPEMALMQENMRLRLEIERLELEMENEKGKRIELQAELNMFRALFSSATTTVRKIN
ncbi:hypothetical protein V6N13_112516 [Hibiscus sabdariffa]|uniref:Uncharacterized protein n=1 Tax=Hibiscus sabdariffa TaxID=183260 RepID=A0ABR2TP04_9ROSI